MKKIYFSVNGVGLGHAGRCISIAREILQKMDVEIVFSTYGKAVSVLRNMGFRTYSSVPIMWYEDSRGGLDYRATMLHSPLIFKKMWIHFRNEYTIIRKEQPDIIVTDSRYTTIPASASFPAPRLYITNQPGIILPENNGRKNVFAERMTRWMNFNLLKGQDHIFLPDFPYPDSISILNMKFDDAPDEFKKKVSFEGPVYPLDPEYVLSSQIEELKDKYHLEDRFIYVAISGPGNSPGSVKNTLMEILKDYKIQSLMTTGDMSRTRIWHYGGITLLDGWLWERQVILSAAEVIISRAGLSTLSEIAAYGKKTLLIPQPNQPEQWSNAMGAKKLGFARVLPQDEVNRDNLFTVLDEVMESKEMEKAAYRVRKMAREYNGRKRIARKIMGYLDT